MSQGKKIIKGGFYLAMTNIFSQLLSIFINIILARILLPDDFGLVALTTTYFGLVMLFTNIGFGSSIIHYQQTDQKHLSTIYWINFILACVSYGILFVTSRFVADFYSIAELHKIIIISSTVLLLTPFFVIHLKILERDLEFRILSQISLLSTVIGAVTSVITALLGWGAYSLVFQPIVSTLTKLGLVLYACKWRPSFFFELNPVKKMIWYSIRYKLSESVLYFERNVDYLILGRIFTSAILGYYSFAYNIMYTPVKRISYIFNDVLFPSLSALKDNKNKVMNGFLQSVQLIAIISFPVMTMLSFNANFIINILFGQKWNEAIPIVQVLCFAGALQSISQLGGVVFSSQGKPEINIYTSLFQALLTVIAILIGKQYGFIFIAYLLLLTKLISLITSVLLINRIAGLSLFSYIISLKGPIITTLLLFALQFATKSGFNCSPGLKLFLMGILVFISTFFLHRKILVSILDIIFEKKDIKTTDLNT